MSTMPSSYDSFKLATPPHCMPADFRSRDNWDWLLSLVQVAATKGQPIEFSIDENSIFADEDACNFTIGCQFPSHEEMAAAFERAAAAIRRAIA